MKSVLLIIPSWVLREAITVSLPGDFVVLACGSIAEGRQLFDQQPDALVLDIDLPGLDGLNFLRERRCDLPPITIVLTSYLDSAFLNDLERLGASHVIRKPCTAGSVSGCIQNCQ